MKTIGLIGGMSWESTVPYYAMINEYVRDRLGGLHSAKIILYSVEFDEIEKCQSNGDWDKSAKILTAAAQALEKAGADFILICTNTMHKVYREIQSGVKVPILHIAQATADVLQADKKHHVLLLGTKYTMTQDFYVSKLTERGFDVMIPDSADVTLVNDVIYKELCVGQINETSKREFLRIIEQKKAEGAEAVILGCTEIGLLVQANDSSLPVYDTTKIHAVAAAEYALR